MGKIITGVSTDEEFRKALTDKGANLNIDSTPEGLLNAFLETGAFVSFQSPNETILEALNGGVLVTIDGNGCTIDGETTYVVELQIGDAFIPGDFVNEHEIVAGKRRVFDGFTTVKDDDNTMIDWETGIEVIENTTLYCYSYAEQN